MGRQKKHRKVNPRFAECLLNSQALHAIESAENEGWPAALMRALAGTSAAVHVMSRQLRMTSAKA